MTLYAATRARAVITGNLNSPMRLFLRFFPAVRVLVSGLGWIDALEFWDCQSMREEAVGYRGRQWDFLEKHL